MPRCRQCTCAIVYDAHEGRLVEHTPPDSHIPAVTPHPDGSPVEDVSARPAAEGRLADIAERGEQILARWTVASERHERVVDQLETQVSDWEVTSARLQRDASQRLQDLEQMVQHEWTALRGVHEEPLKQLREQANSLTEVCIATAHSAQRGFDQAEARLAAIEAEIDRRMTDLRREMQTVVAELRANPGLARLGAAQASWPLEEVTRLHHQLRQGDPQGAPLALEAAAESPDALEPSTIDVSPKAAGTAPTPRAESSTVTDDLSKRLRTLERTLDEREIEARSVEERARKSASAVRLAVIALAAVVVLAGGFTLWMQARVRARVDDAQRRSQEATAEAARQMAATREQAAKEIAAARELAVQAQVVSAVLAAPDLVRYSLGATAEGATGSAQALWSRTRGLVFSGTRLMALPNGSAYQVWLLTRGDAVSAGTAVPDAAGSITLAIQPPPQTTQTPVIGVIVTQEPVTGSAKPVGRLLLARYPIQP